MNHRLSIIRLGVATLCAALAIGLSGCGGGGNSTDKAQADRAIELTTLEVTPSSCSIEPFTQTAFGTIFISYLAIDFPASFLDIVPEYSTNGGVTFFPATEGNGGDGDIAIRASQAGFPHTYAWDTLADLPNSINTTFPNVVFRITTVETNGGISAPVFGAPCVSNVFSVRNNPATLDLGSLSTGLAQEDQTIAILLTNAVPTSDPTAVTLDVVYDSTLITVTGALPGPAAPAGSTTDLVFLSPGRIRVTVTSSGLPFPDGEIITLIVRTACLAPRALPASSAILCDSPSATDVLVNAVAVVCGAAGSTAIIDNSSVMAFDDFVLAVGQATEMRPILYTNGVPSVNADGLTFTLTWDPTQIDIVGATPGPDLDPAGMVTFTPGAGSATVEIRNPAGTPFVDGSLAFILVDLVAATAGTTFIPIGNVVLSASGACPVVPGSFLSPAVRVTITDARSVTTLRAVSALGAMGTPALVAGSAIPGNPKGNWSPLNAGRFSNVVSLQSGGNPVIFFSPTAPGIQIVLQADWSAPPLLSDVSAAMNIDGTTTYMALSGAGLVNIDMNGLLTPAGSNGCTVFEASFVPNGVTAFGPMVLTQFAACVDNGGIDGVTRAGGTLPVGAVDADIPGLPLGDVPPGAGGMFTETVYLSTGPTPVGAYQLRTNWMAARIAVNGALGLNGFDQPSRAALGGPTVVNIMVPGQATANHFTVSMAFSGIFDIWTINFMVMSPGTTNLDHLVESLVSSAVPPVPIGAATPRPAPEASAASIRFP